MPQHARVVFEIGKDKGGYFTSEKFLAQLKTANAIHNYLYPNHTAIWNLDNATIHTAFPSGALCVTHMTVGDDKKTQPNLRDTVWRGQVQTLGKKGLRTTLQERGLLKPGMDKKAMQHALAACPDFAAERSAAEQLAAKCGNVVLFLPKFHCELNSIEMVWGLAKHYTRTHCTGRIDGLRQSVPAGLAAVTVDHIRKFATHCRKFMTAYREGSASMEAFAKVKASHRRAPSLHE
jgi:transposase